jgi:hypothetical protein
MSGDSRLHTLVCIECDAVSTSDAERGWRGYLTEDQEGDNPLTLAFYCPSCAVEAFSRPAPEPTVSRGRRWRDANKFSSKTFRVAVNTAVALSVADGELASAFDVVAAAGGSGVSVLRGGEAEQTRVEFDLEAQNDGHARRLALEALETLAAATPSAPGGWVLAAVSPA